MDPDDKKNSLVKIDNPHTENQSNVISLSEMIEKIIQVVGTFEDIKRRQRMFHIMNLVNGYGDIDSVSISSGSLAEGLDIKGSDEDITLIFKYITAVPSEVAFVPRNGETVVLVDFDQDFPGFATICPLLDASVNSYVQKATVLSSSLFREQFRESGQENHGPCLNDGERDFAFCIHCPFLPEIVIKRFENRQSKWLQEDFLGDILADGCLMVPIGPRNSEKRSILWRISFAAAEKRIILRMNHSQILCYALLKIMLKEGLEQNISVKGLLCSYFLKTCLFWLIDETNNDEQVWNVGNVLGCYELCLEKMILWVTNCNCPNYFIPENNMFRGRICEDNNNVLLSLLKKYKSEGYLALLQCGSFLVRSEFVTHSHREANLDFLCFRVLHIYPFDDIKLAYSAARDLDNLYRTETDGFVLGVINKLRSSVHQEIAQMLPLPDMTEGSEGERPQLLEKHREHISIGGESDAISGAVLLSCLYYNVGTYRQALLVLGEAEDKLTANLVHLRKEIYSKEEYDFYLDSMCGKGLTLVDKLKHATVVPIVMLENSSLIPEEFLPEVKHRPLCTVPAVVLLHSMQYLCYNKLQNVEKRQKAISKLEGVIKTKFLILPRFYSVAFTFLGACFEMEGDNENAMNCYERALENPPLCKSAQYRMNRLLAVC